MCTGNVPSIVIERHNELEEGLDYPDAMRFLCAKSAQILLHRKMYGESLRNVLDQVLQMRDFTQRMSSKLALAHSTEHSTQYLQRIAFRVHMAYTLSYLCKPALMSPDRAHGDRGAISKLLEISTTTLIDALKDYSALLRLTVIAVRSWSLLHNGLGAALMLGMLGELKRNDVVRGLVREILDNLSGADMHGIASGNEWEKRIVSKLQAMYEESYEGRPTAAPMMHKDSMAWPPVNPAQQAMRPRPSNGMPTPSYGSAGGYEAPPLLPSAGAGALPNESFDVNDIQGFDTLFTQDWLTDFEQQMF